MRRLFVSVKRKLNRKNEDKIDLYCSKVQPIQMTILIKNNVELNGLL